MEDRYIFTENITVTPELAAQILKGLETIVNAATSLGDAVLTLTAPKPVAPVAPIAPETTTARVWDTSPEALDNYDAEQLVALRADHRADNHSADGCNVCAVLVRRLGSL